MKDGYVVKQGTRVIIPTFSLQRDPKYFKDPLSFCPERFLRGDPITPGTYMPFGDGPRVCIGE
jgi:cytochrome P450 family 6